LLNKAYNNALKSYKDDKTKSGKKSVKNALKDYNNALDDLKSAKKSKRSGQKSLKSANKSKKSAKQSLLSARQSKKNAGNPIDGTLLEKEIRKSIKSSIKSARESKKSARESIKSAKESYKSASKKASKNSALKDLKSAKKSLKSAKQSFKSARNAFNHNSPIYMRPRRPGPNPNPTPDPTSAPTSAPTSGPTPPPIQVVNPGTPQPTPTPSISMMPSICVDDSNGTTSSPNATNSSAPQAIAFIYEMVINTAISNDTGAIASAVADAVAAGIAGGAIPGCVTPAPQPSLPDLSQFFPIPIANSTNSTSGNNDTTTPVTPLPPPLSPFPPQIPLPDLSQFFPIPNVTTTSSEENRTLYNNDRARFLQDNTTDTNTTSNTTNATEPVSFITGVETEPSVVLDTPCTTEVTDPNEACNSIENRQILLTSAQTQEQIDSDVALAFSITESDMNSGAYDDAHPAIIGLVFIGPVTNTTLAPTTGLNPAPPNPNPAPTPLIVKPPTGDGSVSEVIFGAIFGVIGFLVVVVGFSIVSRRMARRDRVYAKYDYEGMSVYDDYSSGSSYTMSRAHGNSSSRNSRSSSRNSRKSKTFTNEYGQEFEEYDSSSSKNGSLSSRDSRNSRNSYSYTDEYEQELEENPDLETIPEGSEYSSESGSHSSLPHLSRMLKRDPGLERLLEQVGETRADAEML